MKREPAPLERPVLVIGGYLDPGLAASHVARTLRNLTGDERIYSVATLGSEDFDDARRRLFEFLHNALPDQASGAFDVVGISMGGLVARYAASGLPDISAQDSGRPHSPSDRLRIVRLFSIATPHRGARMADDRALHRLQQQMHLDSDFMARLGAQSTSLDYKIIPYVRLDDAVVGVENSAPLGMNPWWVSNRPLEGAHTQAFSDPRILADIARHLRGEKPFSLPDPPSATRQPLPANPLSASPGTPSG